MKKVKELLKLNIGDGAAEGFTNVKLQNPLKWPYPDNSVQEVNCIYLFHKLPGRDRGKFMDEMYRVLAKDGKATVIVPYWSSFRSIMDYRYEWPPVAEMSFLFFNKEWRKSQGIEDLLKCDFDFGYGYTYDPDAVTRADDVRSNWVKHQINMALDLQIVLTKKV